MILLLPIPSIFGQGYDDGYTIWVPQKMIAGKEYEGLVVLHNASNSDRIVSLSTSDRPVLGVPDSVIIPALSNHGIFQVRPMMSGNATVFASLQGRLESVGVMVYASSSKPSSLEVVLADNTTKAESMLAYVFAMDRSGLPSQVEHDTKIYISTSSSIGAPQSVTIPKGGYYVQVPLVTKGTGTVSVSSGSLGTASAKITKTFDKAEVRLAVAPDLVTSNSITHYYLWLEKDGKHLRPPDGIRAVLTSNNTGVARFGSSYEITHYDDIVYSTMLYGGFATGTVYTVGGGSSRISASVDGYGSASATLEVAGLGHGYTLPYNGTLDCNQFWCKPNLVKIWAYPAVSDGKIYGVVGLYRVLNGTNSTIPLPMDGSTVDITADRRGLEHEKYVKMISRRLSGTGQDEGLASSVQFEIDSRQPGNYNITASGAGKTPSSASFEVALPYHDSYRIGMKMLPARTGVQQDLAILYISDGSGAMVAPSYSFGKPLHVTVGSETPGIGGRFEFAQSNIVISGKVSGSTGITAATNGLSAVSGTILPLDVATSVFLDLPGMVHVGERFPYVVHLVNKLGIPLSREMPETVSSSGLDLDGSGRYMTASRSGNESLAVMMSEGAVTGKIMSFYNLMHIGAGQNNTMMEIGSPNQFYVTSDVDNTRYWFDSPFPVIQQGADKFSVSPTRTGSFDVVVHASKDGFMPATATLHFTARKIIDISFTARGTDGAKLHVSAMVSVDNRTMSQTTPFADAADSGLVHIEVPRQFNVTGKNYVLNELDVGDRKFDNNADLFLYNDSRISAVYDRMVKISAAGVHGEGTYPYGTKVRLYAQDKYQMSFFVRQVFDHWEGRNLPFGSGSNDVTFAATDDMVATAVYREDYTYLMLSIALPITGLFVLARRSLILDYVTEHGLAVLIALRKLARRT